MWWKGQEFSSVACLASAKSWIRSQYQKKEHDGVVHACNLSTLESWCRRIWKASPVWDTCELNKTLPQTKTKSVGNVAHSKVLSSIQTDRHTHTHVWALTLEGVETVVITHCDTQEPRHCANSEACRDSPASPEFLADKELLQAFELNKTDNFGVEDKTANDVWLLF